MGKETTQIALVPPSSYLSADPYLSFQKDTAHYRFIILKRYYGEAGDQLRDAAPAPSALALEAAARRWESASTGARWGDATANKALASWPSTRLALLDAAGWVSLVAEALILGLTIQDMLLQGIEKGP